MGSKSDPPLPPPMGRTGQGIFEHLLKSQELDDSQIYGRMEAQTALVGSDSAVELHSEARVDLDLSLIIHPRYPEDDLPLRIRQSFQKSIFTELLLVRFHDNAQRFQNFFYRLVKLRLRRVLFHNLSNYLIDIRHIFILLQVNR